MSAPVRTRDRLATGLGDRFTIVRDLGGGGMSDTFVAHDRVLGRDIVVKALGPALASDVSLERFSREIRFSASLQHPNLVPVLDTGVADGVPYFTMPYVAGDSLRRRLDGTPMPIEPAVSILRDVARGLGAAHAHGVVHRDIKPDNVLLTGDAALVTDLGIAKALSASGNGERLTHTGLALGTPAYFAPEQAAGDAIDAAADWYAFGVMAFEMLTGQLPFTAPTDAGLLVAHVTKAPPDIRTLRPELPEALAALVMACLAKEPADRPQASADVIAALAGATRPHTTPSAITTRPRAAVPSASSETSARRRWPMVAGVIAALSVVAAGVWYAWGGRTASAPPPSGPRTVWIAGLGATDAAAAAEIAAMRGALRERVPLAAAVELAARDTTFADSAGAATFARDARAVVILVGVAARDSGGVGPYATIFTVDGAACPVWSSPAGAAPASRTATMPQLSVGAADLVERVLGTMAIRYDALLVARYLRGARLVSTEAMCNGYRLDALQRLAAYRADSTRPSAARLADLDTALLLDSTFIEAQLDRAMARGDTAMVRAIRQRTQGPAVQRLELAVDALLDSQPTEALALAERGAPTGQVSALMLARARLNAGRPAAALTALNGGDVRQADPDVVDATRSEAYFLMGRDQDAREAVAPRPGRDAAVRALLRLGALAALGDSVQWRAALLEAAPPPQERLRHLLRAAGIALQAGHAAWSGTLYREAREAGETLLAGRTTDPLLALLVADARRHIGDVAGALSLLERLATDRDTRIAESATGLLALVALESGREREGRDAVARLTEWDRRESRWTTALWLARVETRRRNVGIALAQLRRAIALGLPRERMGPAIESGELRADADLAPLFATPEGRALILATE